MAVGIGMDGGRTHPVFLKGLFSGEPGCDGGNVSRKSETFLHVTLAVVVPAANPANGDLVAFGGCVEP